jgi:hypothetical protein
VIRPKRRPLPYRLPLETEWLPVPCNHSLIGGGQGSGGTGGSPGSVLSLNDKYCPVEIALRFRQGFSPPSHKGTKKKL